jgi:hypothetical protein
MNFDNQIQLFSLNVDGALSWLFVLGIVVKLATTATGLFNRTRPFLTSGLEHLIWWGSKVSALSVCSAAFALSWRGNDARGIGVFGVLFILALPLVVFLAAKRTRKLKQLRA